MSDKEKTRQILELLKHRHPQPEWAAFEEFMARTGFDASRIDFLAMNCWPSKQFWIVAYEIKVSRGDFAAELKKPEKRAPAEAVANECFFVAPAGLLKIDEIPEGWGLVEKTKGGLRKVKHATQRKDRNLPIDFVASLARRVQDPPPIYDEPLWKYQDQDLDYHQLMKVAESELWKRKAEMRKAARAEILEGKDYVSMQNLRSVVRSRLGWQYSDPDTFLEWFDEQRNEFIDKDLKLKLNRLQTALKNVLASLEQST